MPASITYKRSNLALFGLLSCCPSLLDAQSARPNIVWLMAEDVSSQFLGLYNGGRGAQLPNLERLFQEGVAFDNAYSNAPVSSAARSTLITGCYGPRLGVSFHRKLELVPLPDGLRMFPSYLRLAGYYTSNASKTDYNCFLDETAWDVVHGKMGEWRNRPDKNCPFFFVRTDATCHESCLQFSVQRMKGDTTFHSLSSVSLLPEHPDTELFRYTYATFYDRLLQVDGELGRMVEMLREDGELDDTFIFYFGDNGGSLPGSKGYTTERGLRVPLVVYIPKNWRNHIPLSVNTHVGGVVSFMDFGPTVLHLAGIEIPESMEGRPFLGEDLSLDSINARDEVYGYGDRFDELYAFNRTVRKGNFKYSRNFLPYHPKSLYAFYRYKQAAFREWRALYEKGKLNAVQRRFFEPQGAEELYDLSVDPGETVNLASSPDYRVELERMRKLLFAHLLEERDLGLFPECVWLDEGGSSPVAYGNASEKRLSKALETANLQLLSFSDGKEGAFQALFSSDPVIRYWALTACVSWGMEAVSLVPAVRKCLSGENPAFVCSRAVVFLSVVGDTDNPVGEMKSALSLCRNGAESLSVLNDMAYLKERNASLVWDLKKEDIKCPCMGTDWRLSYLNGKR